MGGVKPAADSSGQETPPNVISSYRRDSECGHRRAALSMARAGASRPAQSTTWQYMLHLAGQRLTLDSLLGYYGKTSQLLDGQKVRMFSAVE